MSDAATAVIDDADLAAVTSVPQRIIEAWAKHDADAFAAAFTEDGTLILPGDIFLRGREEVRGFMAAAFAGPYQGTRVTGTPLALKPLGESVVLVLTQGGVLAPGEEAVSAERAIRASWLLAKQDGEWLITAYQNTPVKAS
ncbi:SgcJ/EcaC family oxidoreductase [Catellatospora methionotrophica]|uniref:SgcJ/EcaC family oxidoreductase n=1 Tax=Catellatospora methionotrophica TaxID=121620 RepID=UPI0033F2A507